MTIIQSHDDQAAVKKHNGEVYLHGEIITNAEGVILHRYKGWFFISVDKKVVCRCGTKEADAVDSFYRKLEGVRDQRLKAEQASAEQAKVAQAVAKQDARVKLPDPRHLAVKGKVVKSSGQYEVVKSRGFYYILKTDDKGKVSIAGDKRYKTIEAFTFDFDRYTQGNAKPRKLQVPNEETGVMLKFSKFDGDNNLYTVSVVRGDETLWTASKCKPTEANKKFEGFIKHYQEIARKDKEQMEQQQQASDKLAGIYETCNVLGIKLTKCSSVGLYLAESDSSLIIVDEEGVTVKQGHPKLITRRWDRLTKDGDTWEFDPSSIQSQPVFESVKVVGSLTLGLIDGEVVLVSTENNDNVLFSGEKDVYNNWHRHLVAAGQFVEAYSVVGESKTDEIQLLRSKWYPTVPVFAILDTSDGEIVEEGTEDYIMGEWAEYVTSGQGAQPVQPEPVEEAPVEVAEEQPEADEGVAQDEEPEAAEEPEIQSLWTDVDVLPGTDVRQTARLQQNADSPKDWRFILDDGSVYFENNEKKTCFKWHDFLTDRGVDTFEVIEENTDAAIVLLKSKWANVWQVRKDEATFEQGYEKPCRKVFEQLVREFEPGDNDEPVVEEEVEVVEVESTTNEPASNDSTDDVEDEGDDGDLLIYSLDSDQDEFYVLLCDEELELRDKEGNVRENLLAAYPESALAISESLVKLLEASEEWSIINDKDEVIFDSDKAGDNIANEVSLHLCGLLGIEVEEEPVAEEPEIIEEEPVAEPEAEPADDSQLSLLDTASNTFVVSNGVNESLEVPENLPEILEALYRSATEEERDSFDTILASAAQPKSSSTGRTRKSKNIPQKFDIVVAVLHRDGRVSADTCQALWESFHDSDAINRFAFYIRCLRNKVENIGVLSGKPAISVRAHGDEVKLSKTLDAFWTKRAEAVLALLGN